MKIFCCIVPAALLFIFAIFFFPNQLNAQTPIPLINPSFEDPGLRKIKGWDGECADSSWNGLVADIPGWTSDATALNSGVESGNKAAHAMTYLTTPTYDGSDQTVHPDVYYNPNGWHGYQYWMVMTPFPGSDPALENPSILVSAEGQTWGVPAGLTNPIEPAPATGHYADTDILEGLDGRMWIFFNNGSSRVWVKSSADGITWSDKTQILYSAEEYFLSPAVIVQDSVYVMYYIDLLANPNELKRRTATQPDGTWSAPTIMSVTGTPPDKDLWHLDVVKFDDEYHGFINFCTSETSGGGSLLYFAGSEDGLDWKANPVPIIDKAGTGWDNANIYRASAVILDKGYARSYALWYSAMSSASAWHIGYTEVSLGVTPTDGDGAAFLMAADSAIYQITDYLIHADDEIELTVDAKNNQQASLLEVQLFYVDAAEAKIPMISEEFELTSDMQRYAVSFKAADPASMGRRLGVWFDNTSPDAESWVGLDNVALKRTVASRINETPAPPSGFTLAQNYPNPFNPRTEISYTLQNNSRIKLAIYDLTGRELAVLVNGDENAGQHSTVFTGEDLTSGIYFCTLQTPSGVLTKKMTLVK